MKDRTDETQVVIQAAARMITHALNDFLYADPHSWSRRPCRTCQLITELIGEDFGCVRYAQEHVS